MRRREPAPTPVGDGSLPVELAVGPGDPRWASEPGYHEWRRAVGDWCAANGVAPDALPEPVRYWRSTLGRCHVRALRGEGPA